MGKLDLILSTCQSVTLSQQRELRLRWNKTNTDDTRPYIPTMRKNGVTPEEAEQANQGLGLFAESCVSLIVRETPREEIMRRLETRKKFCAVGYGRGHGAKLVEPVGNAGLATLWIDVSDTSCAKAYADVSSQFR